MPEVVVGERSDTAARPIGPCGDGMFTWCEVEMLQDAVCGNGLSLMESRDDDAPADAATGRQLVPHSSGMVGCGANFIEDTLRTFNQELAAQAITNKTLGGVQEEGNNPVTVSTLDGVKASTTSSGRVEKSRYEQFMSMVDAASKAHGAQSVPVADLYVNMGVECNRNSNADAKSKELALLLFEESFSIYQAELGDSHEKTVDCRVHLGVAYRALERYDEALDSFCMAVYMREALLGELHPTVSEIWVLISSVHHARKKLELALKASAKALTGYRNAHGDKHQTVIGVLKTIAQIHIEMGNNDKAVDIQKYVKLHSPKAEV